jgi:hypothetical protein
MSANTSQQYGPFHTPHPIAGEDQACPACQAFGQPDALYLFTGRSLDHLLRDGGSQAWRVKPASVQAVSYVVCFQNRYPPTSDGYYDGQVEHGTAFVVAKIAGLAPPTLENTERPDYRPNSGPRYLVRFNEYAPINLPKAWQHWRNPVIYGSLGAFGIDPNALDFQPMPTSPSESAAAVQSTLPRPHVATVPAALPSVKMTIADAKKALAATFGVDPDAIEITIRG